MALKKRESGKVTQHNLYMSSVITSNFFNILRHLSQETTHIDVQVPTQQPSVAQSIK